MSSLIVLDDSIYLYDVIGADDEHSGSTAADFAAAVRRLSGNRTFKVRINSPGGLAMEGLSIVSAIRDARAVGHNVVCICDGMAASVAAAIFCAGSYSIMSESALLMIHDPFSPHTAGRVEELQQAIEVLTKLKTTLVDLFAKKSGKPRATIDAWMSKETWFTADEAVAAGLADQVSSERDSSLIVQDYAWNAPLRAKAKARAPVDRLLSLVLSETAKVRFSRDYDEAVEHAQIARAAGLELLEKPGATTADFAHCGFLLEGAKNQLATKPVWNTW